MSNLVKVSGTCHCGKISLKGSVEPHMVVACHCTDCQVFSGGPFRNNVMLKSENISIHGKVSNYNKIGGSVRPDAITRPRSALASISYAARPYERVAR